MPPYVSPNSRTNKAASFAIPLAGEARPRARRTGRSRPPGAEMAAPRLRRPLPALKMAAALPRKRRPGEGEGGRASHSPRRPCGEPGRARRRGGAGSRRHRSPHGASAAGSRRCLSGLGGPCGGGLLARRRRALGRGRHAVRGPRGGREGAGGRRQGGAGGGGEEQRARRQGLAVQVGAPGRGLRGRRCLRNSGRGRCPPRGLPERGGLWAAALAVFCVASRLWRWNRRQL